jgi:DNA-binding GntR family transcriptional regulator
MDALLATLARHCARADASSAPKYKRLMAAIQDAMHSGALVAGDRLPTEKDFAAALPYALGTVQKALNGLVSQGLLRRNRRSGTFVSEQARRLDDTSQFDFKHADGKPVGDVMTEITGVAHTGDRGHWAAVLGNCPAGYIEIKRMDRIGSDFRCYVEIYLRADRFGEMLTNDRAKMSGRNIRSVLESQFGASVASLEIASGAVPAPAHVACELGLGTDSTVHRVDITGLNATRHALYMQTVFAPPGDYRLTLGKEIN